MRIENVMEGVEAKWLPFEPYDNHKMLKKSIGHFSSKVQGYDKESKTTDDKLYK